MWGIPYRVLALMMADAPGYNYDKEDKKEEKQVIKLTSENAQLMLQNFVNQNE